MAGSIVYNLNTFRKIFMKIRVRDIFNVISFLSVCHYWNSQCFKWWKIMITVYLCYNSRHFNLMHLLNVFSMDKLQCAPSEHAVCKPFFPPTALPVDNLTRLAIYKFNKTIFCASHYFAGLGRDSTVHLYIIWISTCMLYDKIEISCSFCRLAVHFCLISTISNTIY